MKQKIVKEILSLLSVQSVTGNEFGISECQSIVEELAEKKGFLASRTSGGKVLIISPKKLVRPAKLGIVVHLDTVPISYSEWKYNPLGEVKNGRIYGRGVIDDKGAIIIALNAFESLKGKIEDSWEIIIGSSEEGSWDDMEEFLEETTVLPEFLVTIDGDGVQRGCRGYMDLRLKFERETSTNIVKKIFVPGGSNNTIPARCVMNLEDDRNFLGSGKEAHSSIPFLGRSAITELATRVSGSVYEEYKCFFDLLKLLDTTFDGSIIGFEETEVSATNVFLDENGLILNLNLRLEKDVTQKDLNEILKVLEEKYRCHTEVKEFIRPSAVSAEAFQIKAMKKAYAKVLNKEATVTIARGVGYNAALPNCAIFGPRFEVGHDEEDYCHQTDESRSVADIMKFFEMFKIFVKEVL